MGSDTQWQPSTKETEERKWTPDNIENDLNNRIEQEANLIARIYPKLQHETIKKMLTKLGNLPKRSRAVLRELSTQQEQKEQQQNGFKKENNVVVINDDDDEVPQYLRQGPTKNNNFNQQFSRLQTILPDADPYYLKMQLVRLENDSRQLNMFVNNSLRFHNYPLKSLLNQMPGNILQARLNNGNFGKIGKQTAGPSFVSSFPKPIPPPSRQKRPAPTTARKKKQKNMEDEVNLDDLFNRGREDFPAVPYNSNNPQLYNLGTKRQNQRTVNYPRETSVEILPKEDPTLYTTKFNVKNFVESIPDPETYFRENRHTKPWNEESERYATCALFNIYNKINLDKIKECIFIAPNFLAACDMLEKIIQPQGKFRSDLPMPPLVNNVPLLKEIAYKTHYVEIMLFIKTQKEVSRLKIAKAKETGSIHKCECCLNEEVLPEDVFKCEKNCCFCRVCVRTGVEVSLSTGKVTFKCLKNCRAEFSLHTLQRALPEQLFSKVTGKKQDENLDCCPFCEFSAVAVSDGQVFYCLNPVCMKESCRVCKAQNHLPDACEDVERDENVGARTYIENKMTEAIIRVCYECKTKFVKSAGCNTITCPCGAQMCYICTKPVTDLYLHRGCQKHSVARIDEERVTKAAQEARKEVFSILKIDPTVGLKRYFEELRKINLEFKQEDEADNFSGSGSVFQGPSKRRKVEDVNLGTPSSSGPPQRWLGRPTRL